MRCSICNSKIAVYKCRRCGREVCGECIGYHGLCRLCAKYLPRLK